MSILIKGMTMPKCCDDCNLLYDCCSCIVTGHKVKWDSERKRLPDCPLIELPDHEEKAYALERSEKWPHVLECREDPSHPFADSVMMGERSEE